MDFHDEEHHWNPSLSSSSSDTKKLVGTLSRLRPRKEISRAGWNEGQMIDSHEEEEHHRNPFLNSSSNQIPVSLSRPQFRKEVSRAQWNEGMKMGEIVEKKGQSWATTGVVRDGGKLYCSIEEILFLAERGALILLDAMDNVLHLEDIYTKVADGRNGCSWEAFLAYKRLKSLGYIVGRHGVPWTLKQDKKCCSLSMQADDLVDDRKSLVPEQGSDSSKFIIRQLNEVHVHELKLEFDVYLPDSKFKKSSPGDPFCVLCIIRGNPPSRAEIEHLKRIAEGVPVKLCYVDHWLVNFFSYDKVELPVLP